MSTLREGSELRADELARLLTQGCQNRLIVLMGLPTSVTALSSALENLGAACINHQAMRRLRCRPNDMFGLYEYAAFVDYYKALKAALNKGGVVVSVEAITSLDDSTAYNAARFAGYTEITTVWVDVPLDLRTARASLASDLVLGMAKGLQRARRRPLHKAEDNTVVITRIEPELYMVVKVRERPSPSATSQSR